jgi:hypothetical protein
MFRPLCGSHFNSRALQEPLHHRMSIRSMSAGVKSEELNVSKN